MNGGDVHGVDIRGGVTWVCTGRGRKQNACPVRGGNAAKASLCAPPPALPSPLTHAATAPKGTSFRCRVASSQAMRRACPPLRPDTTKNETCSWDSKEGTVAGERGSSGLPPPCTPVSPLLPSPPLPSPPPLSPPLPPDTADSPSRSFDSLPRYLSIVTVTRKVSSGKR